MLAYCVTGALRRAPDAADRDIEVDHTLDNLDATAMTGIYVLLLYLLIFTHLHEPRIGRTPDGRFGRPRARVR